LRSYLNKMKAGIGLGKLLWDYFFIEPLMALFRWIPGGYGFIARSILYKILLKSVGKDTTIAEGVKIQFPERVRIGKNCSINQNSFLDGNGEITIGNWVRIGAGSYILTVSHNYEQPDLIMKKQGLMKKPVIIENDVVLGVKVVIYPGVKIGKGSYIGAGSVVASDIPPYSVAIGFPARVIKQRKKE